MQLNGGGHGRYCPLMTAADRCFGDEEGTAGEDEPGSGVTAMGCRSTAE
jgi:hypothetical protein